ncbi:hypothetical protein [Piscinibacter sp. HJYY11]|uniref:hypothetical protein n=1 Tax=Piscinibacter sp. HJYY11 TaxID=2801333 RepID=UPI00192023CE|nr:hypothetical protein [Piscinibacter sp. HJYY11]MBL0730876.1 hypothetical protein [Piscinibacter sp. HJYY11]
MSTELDPRLSAVERLALSRERLRGALQELSPPRHDGDDGGPSVLMTALMAIPGVNTVVESVRNWWSQHPLHLATLVAGNTARSAVEPVARRSPFGLILVAAAIGGLLYWVKPWRGLLKPALLAGMVPHLVSRVMDHVPLESWMSAVSTFVNERMHGGNSPDTKPEAAPPGNGAAPSASAQTGVKPGTASSDPAPPIPSTGTLH